MFRTSAILAVLGAACLLTTGCPSDGGAGGGGATKTPAQTPDSNGGGGNGGAAMGANTIEGVVTFTGTVPKRKKLRRSADAFCAKTEAFSETVLVADGKLQNVIVRVTAGAADVSSSASPEPLDQQQCMYVPHVMVIQMGETLTIKNSDPTLHNIHTYKGAPKFKKSDKNAGVAPNKEIQWKFADGGEVVKLKCDVHPWMAGYVAVASNPFSAVSGPDGAFKIEKLPAGTYTLQAWHEKYGAKTVEVTVEDGKPASASFEYSGAETAMK